MKPNNKTIIRLRTSYWLDKRGLHQKRDIIFLRKKCDGFIFLEEDAMSGGPDIVMKAIVNLDKCKDGLYLVIPVNISTDWETGYIDDYDYELVEYKDNNENHYQ